MTEPQRPCVGDPVRVHTPENERLHDSLALVVRVQEWGCHLDAPAAATGRFRAAWDEMRPVLRARGIRADGYAGDPCDQCGALTLRRNGSCLLCDSCGATSGCS